MIADRYGVVNEVERNTYEKMFQVPFGYTRIFWKYDEAIKECKKRGAGFVVEKVSTDIFNQNTRSIIYRA